MEKKEKQEDKSTWATGGGLLMGLGVGFILLEVSTIAFIGCIIAGLGMGLILTAIISKPNRVHCESTTE